GVGGVVVAGLVWGGVWWVRAQGGVPGACRLEVPGALRLPLAAQPWLSSRCASTAVPCRQGSGLGLAGAALSGRLLLAGLVAVPFQLVAAVDPLPVGVEAVANIAWQLRRPVATVAGVDVVAAAAAAAPVVDVDV